VTDYLKKSFSVALGSEKYRDNFDQVFRKRKCSHGVTYSVICRVKDCGEVTCACSNVCDKHSFDPDYGL
jgi:hypothetical protein